MLWFTQMGLFQMKQVALQELHFALQLLMEIQCKGPSQCLYEVKLLNQIDRTWGAQHEHFDPTAFPLAMQHVPCRHLLRT